MRIEAFTDLACWTPAGLLEFLDLALNQALRPWPTQGWMRGLYFKRIFMVAGVSWRPVPRVTVQHVTALPLFHVVVRSSFALHYDTLHYTTLHYTTLHYTTLQYYTLRFSSLLYATLYFIILHFTTCIQ